MIQMMLGPKAYGFPIGQRIGAQRDCDSQIVTMAEEQAFWFNFTLPVPKNVKGFDGQKSCLIMLLLFLIAPGLKRIPAFNVGGTGWKRTRCSRRRAPWCCRVAPPSLYPTIEEMLDRQCEDLRMACQFDL